MSRRGLVTGLAVAVLAGALLTAAWMRQAGPGASPTVTDVLPGGAAPSAEGAALAMQGNATTWGVPDGDARRALMQRYATELDEDVRGALLAELQRHPDDELRDFALELVSGGDAATRLRGYDLLAVFPLGAAEVRDAVLAGLGNERNPQVLAQVVGLAVPTVLPASDAEPMADALQALTSHRDPDVRARSVVHAAQWAEPEQARQLLTRAILDESPQVRHAAIAGVIATRAHSPQLKEALLWTASDAGTSDEQRAAAVFALQWYRLDDKEYAIYRQAERDTGGHAH